VSFAAITLCVSCQRVFIAVVYFVIDSVWKLLDTSSYCQQYEINNLTLNLYTETCLVQTIVTSSVS
jgi:hypothetical protein